MVLNRLKNFSHKICLLSDGRISVAAKSDIRAAGSADLLGVGTESSEGSSGATGQENFLGGHRVVQIGFFKRFSDGLNSANAFSSDMTSALIGSSDGSTDDSADNSVELFNIVAWLALMFDSCVMGFY